MNDTTMTNTPAPNATRAAGRVSVDAQTLLAVRDQLADGWCIVRNGEPCGEPDCGQCDYDNTVSELIATAAPLAPAVVDAGTLAQWRNDADRLDKSAGRSDSVIVSGDCRSGAFALRAACDALAAAAQPARAVPSRDTVEAALVEIAQAARDNYGEGDGDDKAIDRALALIYGDAPADASREGDA